FLGLVESQYNVKTCVPTRFDKQLSSFYAWTRLTFDAATEQANSPKGESVKFDDFYEDDESAPVIGDNESDEIAYSVVDSDSGDIDYEFSVSRSDSYEQEDHDSILKTDGLATHTLGWSHF